MARDPRYDILFEPVKIGPVTAKNRFFQVPHCTGMGDAKPRGLAAMREVKAEGGWGVVCTEYCSIHPSSDDGTPSASLWDESDVRDQALMVEAVHKHGALAGVELWYGGLKTGNPITREVPLGPVSRPVLPGDPVQTRAMDRADIKAFRGWHLAATKRALQAGFDLVYVYAGHGYLPMQFLSRRTNDRADEYGGSLENRARLLRELIDDTKEAVAGKAGVVVRLAVEELVGETGLTADGDGRAVVELLAELPDLWDVNISTFDNDARTSRFVKEAAQEPYISFVKQLTTKPVVGVGRFTSPDTMVSQIKRGVLDMIGAARPSIADPFLPKKIEEGRPDDIRECIGCNVCVIHHALSAPIRCTQNPTMGEEERRGWHPEIIAPKVSDDPVLIVGAGPAGLECARALGRRGCEVHLAESTTELGGRVSREAKLPGLSEWIRVRDYRVNQILPMPNVNLYRDSHLGAEEVLEFGFPRVVLATGASWRRDGVGRANPFPVLDPALPQVLTPDDVMAGVAVPGPVLVFDDDHYYMGAVVAEKLRDDGLEVTLVTPNMAVSAWTGLSLEQHLIQTRILEKGIEVIAGHSLSAYDGSSATLACVFTGKTSQRPFAAVVTVTGRHPNDALYHLLADDPGALEAAGIKSVTRIGDCNAPGIIAAAVYAGHRYARELDAPEDAPLRRFERATV